jgi:hypothetical protein
MIQTSKFKLKFKNKNHKKVNIQKVISLLILVPKIQDNNNYPQDREIQEDNEQQLVQLKIFNKMLKIHFNIQPIKIKKIQQIILAHFKKINHLLK